MPPGQSGQGTGADWASDTNISPAQATVVVGSATPTSVCSPGAVPCHRTSGQRHWDQGTCLLHEMGRSVRAGGCPPCATPGPLSSQPTGQRHQSRVLPGTSGEGTLVAWRAAPLPSSGPCSVTAARARVGGALSTLRLAAWQGSPVYRELSVFTSRAAQKWGPPPWCHPAPWGCGIPPPPSHAGVWLPVPLHFFFFSCVLANQESRSFLL